MTRILTRGIWRRRIGGHPGGEYLLAEREPGGDREVRLQAGLDGPAAGADDRWLEDGSLAIGGDFNVIPEDIDCHKPSTWAHDALFQPEPRARYRALLNLGYTDAFRSLHPDEGGHLLSGIIFARRLSAIGAYGSTISCCRRRWRHGWWGARSIRGRGRWRSLRTTRRLWWS